MKDNKHSLAFIFLLLAIIALSVTLFAYLHGRTNTEQTSDTIIIHDTLRERGPVAHDSIFVRKDVVRLKVVREPVFAHLINKASKLQLIADSAIRPTETPLQPLNDSVDVEIPITQKTYATKQYKAWVSGYRPNLDSIEVYNDTKIITNTIRPKSKHWGLGVQAGYGFGGTAFKPYIGIGVHYSIFNW